MGRRARQGGFSEIGRGRAICLKNVIQRWPFSTMTPRTKQETAMDATSPPPGPEYELRFATLFGTGRAFAFPCDVFGHVNLAGLSEAGRQNYRLACASVGREVALPEVLALPEPAQR
jgi:hypothetical protein